MKPEVNAVLQEVKASLANPQPKAEGQAQPVDVNTLRLPDFKTMSIMEATKWCVENGIDKPQAITNLTGKTSQSVYTALWKIRNPKRVKVLARRAKKAKAIKAGKTPTPKTKTIKITKPKIENGLYEDGMETPFLDALNRQRTRFDLTPTPTESNLEAENRRLKILVEHYESLLFTKGVK